MKLITEVNETVKVIHEQNESGKKDYFIEGIFMQGAIKNRNGRLYPVEILQKEVKRYYENYVSKNRAYGELGHPSGPTINLDRVSHIIKELKQDGTNFIGKAKIIDSPMGNIVKNLLDEGAGIGVSSRGMGSVKKNRNGDNEVQEDFFLATPADIVADPSAPDAFVNGIMEGVEWAWGAAGELVAIDTKKMIEEAAKSRELERRKLQIFESFLQRLSQTT